MVADLSIILYPSWVSLFFLCRFVVQTDGKGCMERPWSVFRFVRSGCCVMLRSRKK